MKHPRVWSFERELDEIQSIVDKARAGDVDAIVAVEEIAFRRDAEIIARDAQNMLEPLVGIKAVDRARARISQARSQIKRNKYGLMMTSQQYLRKVTSDD